MYNEIFPYANIIVGILIFIVGFIFHWIGQLISVINWDYATKIGLQEKKMLPELNEIRLNNYKKIYPIKDIVFSCISSMTRKSLIGIRG